MVTAPRCVLIDEFTYLFEYMKESIIAPSFMRQWKALLELGLFSAVVVGQDSMPKFNRRFRTNSESRMMSASVIFLLRQPWFLRNVRFIQHQVDIAAVRSTD